MTSALKGQFQVLCRDPQQGSRAGDSVRGCCSHPGERWWWLALEEQRWGREKSMDSGCNLKTEPTGFANGWKVRYEREREASRTKGA